jgi:hypothetical protein
MTNLTRHMTLTDKLNVQASANVNLAGQAILAAHEAGYDANYEGVLLRDNPHTEGSGEYGAWEAGHLQAQSVRREWEESL